MRERNINGNHHQGGGNETVVRSSRTPHDWPRGEKTRKDKDVREKSFEATKKKANCTQVELADSHKQNNVGNACPSC